LRSKVVQRSTLVRHIYEGEKRENVRIR
jgi:hypothetical protein